MQILYPGRYCSVRMSEQLNQKAQYRRLPSTCLCCDMPRQRLGPCQTCHAPVFIGIVKIDDQLYVQQHTAPITLALYEKAIQTRQKYDCLSCDGRIDEEGYCEVCDAKTKYCFYPLGGHMHPSIRPDAIPMNSEIDAAFVNPLSVRLIDRGVYILSPEAESVPSTPESNTPENTAETQTSESNTPENDSVNTPETDTQRIRRLRQSMSLREIEAETGFSLGKIRHHLKD